MIRFARTLSKPAAPRVEPHDTVRAMGATTDKLGLATVPAAWPTGVSHLAQAIDACQRCDTADVCTDWLRRVPNSIVVPAFCPNADAFKRVKERR